jgi:hypothetical protein
MVAAVLYSLITLTYVLVSLILGVFIIPILVRTEIMYDLGIAAMGLVSAVLLYTQALAILTATERLVSIMGKVT